MSYETLTTTPRVIRETSRGLECTALCDEFFARREIHITGIVDRDMAYALCHQLRYLWLDDPSTQITIFVNSPGGSVQDGLAIYDVMQAIDCPIRTVCLGMAASMAALLFIAGDERDMLPHAQVMIHDPLVAGGLSGSALEIQTAAESIMRTRQITAEVIARHTGHSIEEVLATTARDTYFEAAKAVAWGLADRVIVRF